MTTPATDRNRSVASTTDTSTGEIDDAEFGRLLARGAAIGVPLAYLMSLLVALPGTGAPMAFMIAAWPAIVAGPWVGATALLFQRSRSLESTRRTVTLRAPLPVPVLAPVRHAA